MDEAEFHKRATSNLKGTEDPEISTKVEEFKKLSCYVAGDYEDDAAYQNLNRVIEDIESKYKSPDRHRLFYMALPPSVFIPVARGLKKNCYSKDAITRVIVEKPFGKDFDSCRELLSALQEQFTEEETFRIDHYLGKEMVKNMLVSRFANTALSAGWDKNSISNVQITFKEPFGTEGRGGYFDEFGIIRDVLSILTMERPVSFSAEDIRDEKVKVLRTIPPIKKEDVLVGQYVSANGKPGYLDDNTVPPNSKCATFVAVVLWINNPRWEGVPFIMKAGKALNEAKVEVRVQYKDVTQGIFKDIARNELVMRIQPSEAIYLKFNAKTPGLYSKSIPTEMDLTYKRRFADAKIPEAYEALILDALHGDKSNFVRDDELDVSWKVHFHTNSALARGERWTVSPAASLPLRLARAEGTRRFLASDKFGAIAKRNEKSLHLSKAYAVVYLGPLFYGWSYDLRLRLIQPPMSASQPPPLSTKARCFEQYRPCHSHIASYGYFGRGKCDTRCSTNFLEISTVPKTSTRLHLSLGARSDLGLKSSKSLRLAKKFWVDKWRCLTPNKEVLSAQNLTLALVSCAFVEAGACRPVIHQQEGSKRRGVNALASKASNGKKEGTKENDEPVYATIASSCNAIVAHAIQCDMLAGYVTNMHKYKEHSQEWQREIISLNPTTTTMSIAQPFPLANPYGVDQRPARLE
ncbi:10580_t:CDS:10, partial [Acaulospora colombiana]